MEDIKKHLFWGVSGVVVLTISVMWFLAVVSLNEERTKNEGRISGTFTRLEKIADNKNHPNDKFDDGMTVILNSVKTDIHKTWQDKYNVQKQSLNWPVGPGELDRINKRSGEFTGYLIEVCTKCGWNHMIRSTTLGKY